MDFLSVVDALLAVPPPLIYLGIFGVLILCGLGLPIPEDISLIAAGVSCYLGLTNPLPMILLCLVAVVGGDSFIFLLGYKYGRKLTKKWFFHKILPDERLVDVSKKFNERGTKLLFFARFMPGLRAPVFFSAGTLHVPFKTFLFYDGSAAMLSVPLIVGGVFLFGDLFEKVVRVIHDVQSAILAAIALTLIYMGYKWFRHRKKVS